MSIILFGEHDIVFRPRPEIQDKSAHSEEHWQESECQNQLDINLVTNEIEFVGPFSSRYWNVGQRQTIAVGVVRVDNVSTLVVVHHFNTITV